jgi:hypothetical protein
MATTAAIAGAAALAAATPAIVIEITVGTTTRLARFDTELSGWDRHGPALLVLAACAALMAVGALRGARPAMAAVTACGLAALAIAIATDLPHLHDTGQVGDLYTDASAGPKAGFYLEVAGGALLTFAGAALLAAQRGVQRATTRSGRRHERATSASESA